MAGYFVTAIDALIPFFQKMNLTAIVDFLEVMRAFFDGADDFE